MRWVTGLAFVALFFSGLETEARRGESVPRTVMVQLFSWPWEAIGEECEKVLGPAGYSAVQVSPPNEHIVHAGAPWWERYQPVSYRLESRSGSEAAFARMVSRCQAVGVDVYADVVLNHMNAIPAGRGFAGTPYTHYQYAALWSYGDFHHCGRNGDDGLRDFTDLYELQNCELLGLADLNTSAPPVQEKLAGFLNHLLDLGVNGFRIDAAKHIAAVDLLQIFQRTRRSAYRVQELIISPGEPVNLRDYLPVGDLNVFPYAYALGQAFAAGDLRALPGLAGATGVRSEDAVVFLENHDLERRPASEPLLAYVRDPVLHQLGLVFLLAWPYGYPQVYSGYTFSDENQGPPLRADGQIATPILAASGECLHPWTCTHRLPWVRALVHFRNRTNGQFVATDIWSEGPAVLAFGRGTLGHVVLSLDAQVRDLVVPTRLAPGTYCNLLERENCATVDGKGRLHLTLAARSAFVALAPERERTQAPPTKSALQ